MQQVMLRNGVILPQIGLGTWQITDREQMKSLIARALEEGYSLFDTAAAYSNEIAFAKAVEASGVTRDRIFISDKVWNTSRGYEPVQEACRRSLKKCKTDYFDLYLVHWPASPKLYPNWQELNAETWRGMEALYRDGLVRAIGVCNFKPHHLEALRATAQEMPMIDQMELHPGMPQAEALDYCRQNAICVEASSPLGNGQVLEQPVLRQIAQHYGKSVPQICLRWSLQKGILVIPKTGNPEHLRGNLEVFDFSLTEEECTAIDAMPFCGGLGIDPDEVTQFG